MSSSEELSTLSATARFTKLGTAGVAAAIGLVSIVITLIYSVDNYIESEISNTQKMENVILIDSVSGTIQIQSEEIDEIINNTEDLESREKLIEYQKNVEILINNTRDTKEILEKDIKNNYKGSSINFGFISNAYADTDQEAVFKKQYILWAILCLLALVYLGALYSLFFSRNSRNIELATDLVKTLTGFYIGIVTSTAA